MPPAPNAVTTSSYPHRSIVVDISRSTVPARVCIIEEDVDGHALGLSIKQ